MEHQRVMITGGSGAVGTMLRPRLARTGRTLRLLDLADPPPLAGPGPGPGPGPEETVRASVTDAAVLAEAFRDVQAVVHLGGKATEASLEDIVQINVLGTNLVLEAARAAGVRRVVLASSNHAVGFTPRTDAGDGDLPADVPARPDTFYGWSKVAMEAAGRLYADRYGMDVLCLRIGTCAEEPYDVRSLATWLSPDDVGRLVEACLTVPEPGFRVVWGVSRNTRRWWSLAEGEAIGYSPADDAEVFAARLIPEGKVPDFTGDPVLNRVGGDFCDAPLGEPH
ncbi:MAG: NAD-dependent epimerase/dehydratase family protein [Streptosporangiales bacterium]|nr:NAD-dependent epimerase/dehydratase family protein [Streptosporangiales bacterium]